ncbi:MAG: PDZ domain-containing protein [Zoogloea sp.]|nr:PDZ domain-containing protein [Zoogloea sp.]
MALASLLLGACSTVQYTVDDGRKVNETLLANLRALGHGERALRPAIARSAALNDPDCSRQWELPISVATSFEWEEDDRVAWVRALQVDERLTVVAAAPDAGLVVGDKIVEIDGYKKKDSNKMLAELASLRDDGDPFPVKTAAGKTVTLKPFQVCRGYTRLAPPVTPGYQDFHWLMSVHPLDIFRPQITPDEALWMVLWTQGLSEEGGARMKTYHYSKEIVSTLFEVASLATGLNAAAQAAKVAVNQAAQAAAAAATKAAGEAAAKAALEEAARRLAEQAAQDYVKKVGEEVAKSVGRQAGNVLRDTFMARVGMSVSSLSWVATTAFDDADRWAWDRIGKIGGDPLAGATLHQKLLDQGLVSNAFVLDEERLVRYSTLARQTQREDMLAAVLKGASLEAFALKLTDLPSASDEGAGLAMLSESDEAVPSAPAGAAGSGGLIDAMLRMPLETGQD